MSRAFVKENDLEHAGIDIPERPVSTHANYVTPNGLNQLEIEARDLEQQKDILKSGQDPQARQKIAVIERDLRYLAARLGSAVLVDTSLQPLSANTVLFGATVTIEDDNGEQQVFTIVGEDEADMSCNKVSYISPIAKALIGRKLADTVEWIRPIGNTQLSIIDIKFVDIKF